MKKIKLLLVAVIVLTSGTALKAQDKLAYINSGEVLQLMPETDSAQRKLESFRVELTETFEAMKTEYTTKLAEMQKKLKEWTESMQAQKNKELNTMVESIQSFEQDASEQLSNKQRELMEPIIKKLKDAITAVGKEHGFTYILDSSTGSLVYINEAKATNAAPLVKTKLGIK